MLPVLVMETAVEFLEAVDRAIPGRVEGFYVVGSACLGAFRAGRSDLDFVAVIDGTLEPLELQRMRRMVLRRWALAIGRDLVLSRRWPLVCNGVYVTRCDLGRSALAVVPAAAHVASRFTSGGGFDVNPVTWHVLGRHGVAIRGPDPSQLSICSNQRELRTWTRDNLSGYWRQWLATASRHASPALNPIFRRGAAWGVLGAPRLHYTIATGEVISKEQAGHYALETFSSRWHPVIHDALAYWRSAPGAGHTFSSLTRQQDALGLVAAVIADATNEPSRRGTIRPPTGR